MKKLKVVIEVSVNSDPDDEVALLADVLEAIVDHIDEGTLEYRVGDGDPYDNDDDGG